MALSISAIFLTNFNWAQTSQIELVHADEVTNSVLFIDAVKVIGNVHFKHEQPRNLYCDSAYLPSKRRIGLRALWKCTS